MAILSRLESLPNEVKLNIWCYVFAGTELKIRDKKITRRTTVKLPPILDVFLISKSCLPGMMDALLSTATLAASDNASAFVLTIKQRNLVQNLSLVLDHHHELPFSMDSLIECFTALKSLSLCLTLSVFSPSTFNTALTASYMIGSTFRRVDELVARGLDYYAMKASARRRLCKILYLPINVEIRFRVTFVTKCGGWYTTAYDETYQAVMSTDDWVLHLTREDGKMYNLPQKRPHWLTAEA